MIKTSNISSPLVQALMQKLVDYKQLVKLNLSLMVVFSCVVGYWVAPNIVFSFKPMFILFLGGMFVTGAANACNEIIEYKTDALMKRTSNRPLPTGRMSTREAGLFAAFCLTSGIALLWWNFNTLSAFLSLISFVIYVLAYTPLKRISNINVFVGAISGSLPALIGWAAATNNLSLGGWNLFALQFLWQFPHFWSIAYLADADYKAAGLKMLPTEDKNSVYTSVQCVQYCVVLLAFSIMPWLTGVTGVASIFFIAAGAVWFLYNAINFYKNNSDTTARKLMFASFVYMPVVYLVMIIDKL